MITTIQDQLSVVAAGVFLGFLVVYFMVIFIYQDEIGWKQKDQPSTKRANNE